MDLGNCIDELHNEWAVALYDWLQAHRFAGIRDIVVAYSSVSLFYDPAEVRVDGMAWTDGIAWAAQRMENFLLQAWSAVSGGDAGSESLLGRQRVAERPVIRIPVCYDREYAPDIEWVARQTALLPREIVDIHIAGIYRVYMIGFLPGFPYMGVVDERLHVSRKDRPAPVAAGGVGIAGRQTGIYPLASPGGWPIIGRTPLRLFDSLAEPPARLQSGDTVQFYPVSPEEFRRLAGMR